MQANTKRIIKIIQEISELDPSSSDDVLKVLRKHPTNSGLNKKSEILSIYRKLKSSNAIKLTKDKEENFLRLIRVKKTRSISGVTPVTVLTKPYPCPGKCIFCPNDTQMPKSYISSEPGAQRAANNNFDPYKQTYNRLVAYNQIGHPTDKVELIILGGTWTFYPQDYQTWFITKCLEALNDFDPSSPHRIIESVKRSDHKNNFPKREGNKSYNQLVSKKLLIDRQKSHKNVSWEELTDTQAKNTKAKSRCVGLVIETRPDEINEKEIIRLRKLGVTKVQLGFQSLDDKILKLNKRGHGVDATRNAVNMLRLAGFKIHAHWMPNLYGSSPQKDIKDFKKMFSDGDFMPDELKIYPCSLIENTELMKLYKKGAWKPYTEKELLFVLRECYKLTPPYARITRMVRDIGSNEIVAGNKKTNFREMVENSLRRENDLINEIRFREIRSRKVSKEDLHVDIFKYKTSVSEENFIQYITKDHRIAGFLRLSLPDKKAKNFIKEISDSAIIREVHIYGQSLQLGKKSKNKAQHLGLGKNLIKLAKKIAKLNGYPKISVISAIGTKEYYRNLGFSEGRLYQHLSLDSRA